MGTYKGPSLTPYTNISTMPASKSSLPAALRSEFRVGKTAKSFGSLQLVQGKKRQQRIETLFFFLPLPAKHFHPQTIESKHESFVHCDWVVCKIKYGCVVRNADRYVYLRI